MQIKLRNSCCLFSGIFKSLFSFFTLIYQMLKYDLVVELQAKEKLRKYGISVLYTSIVGVKGGPCFSRPSDIFQFNVFWYLACGFWPGASCNVTVIKWSCRVSILYEKLLWPLTFQMQTGERQISDLLSALWKTTEAADISLHII